MNLFAVVSPSGVASKYGVRHVVLVLLLATMAMVVLSPAVKAAPVLSFQSFSAGPTNADGSPSTQAGAHPFELTTAFALNTFFDSRAGTEVPDAATKDTVVELPPGIIGDPAAVPQCNPTEHQNPSESCPVDTQVGYADVELTFFSRFVSREPIYNMVPPAGEPAQFRFTVVASFVDIDFKVRSGGNYGVTASVHGINAAAPLFGVSVHLWGVPSAASHDAIRGGSSGALLKPFLRNPTACTGPTTTTLNATSWEEPEWVVSMTSTAPEMTGCAEVPFTPTIAVTPDSTQAATPAGYAINLKLPQSENLEGLGEADLKDAKVMFPAGTVLSASAATGLEGCPAEGPEGINLHAAEVEIEHVEQEPRGQCPQASKIGSAEVETPLFRKPLKGSMYIAQPKCGGAGQAACTEASATNGELYGLYLEVYGSGVVVKLAGEVHVDPQTGQITALFKENPQLPFNELRLHLEGGPQAALANPVGCGTYTTSSDMTPWTAPFAPDVTPSSSFTIDQQCGGQGFAPVFTAGTTNNQAGTYSPFTLTFSRNDGEQDIGDLQQTLPPGLLAKLAGVPLCSDADAVGGSCPEASRIGSVSVAVGAGSEPFYTTGKIFLTAGYNGGAYGEVVQVPAVAGPFNLGMVVIRGSIRIDPHTAQAAVVSDPFPSILDGIPLQIKTVNVNLDRPGFTFNPTNCSQLATSGSISSTQGATVPVSSPFQAANCANLKFKPGFSASTAGKASKASGASLSVKLVLPAEGPQSGGSASAEANIARVKVDLPKALPSRLTTLQKACTAAQFDANPAGCPAASAVGHAKAITPILAAPLEGPVYFVSHGGEAFPSLIMVLQGNGVRIDLVGTTFISKQGITSSTFQQVPDAPLSNFELTLPQGKYSALSANGDLCTSKLGMPTEFVAQNGAVIHQTTKIVASGCAKAKAVVLTRAQKLAKALKACKKKAKGKRAACEKQARKKYGAAAKKKAKKK
jgi:hypothetical protein